MLLAARKASRLQVLCPLLEAEKLTHNLLRRGRARLRAPNQHRPGRNHAGFVEGAGLDGGPSGPHDPPGAQTAATTTGA